MQQNEILSIETLLKEDRNFCRQLDDTNLQEISSWNNEQYNHRADCPTNLARVERIKPLLRRRHLSINPKSLHRKKSLNEVIGITPNESNNIKSPKRNKNYSILENLTYKELESFESINKFNKSLMRNFNTNLESIKQKVLEINTSIRSSSLDVKFDRELYESEQKKEGRKKGQRFKGPALVYPNSYYEKFFIEPRGKPEVLLRNARKSVIRKKNDVLEYVNIKNRLKFQF